MPHARSGIRHRKRALARSLCLAISVSALAGVLAACVLRLSDAKKCDPADCSGHGTCSYGTCGCNPGFAGSGCELCAAGYTGYPACTAAAQCSPPDCNGHGTCVIGACTCNTGYAGSGCDTCATAYTGYPTCTAKPPPLPAPAMLPCGKLTLVEAESTGVGVKQTDPTASGGAYVSGTSSQWDWIFVAPVPAGSTDLTVWARGRDIVVETKDANGTSLGWGWFLKDWYWMSLGRFTRAQLNGTLKLTNVQNPDWDNPHRGIDAVMFAEDPACNPNSEKVTSTVDFTAAPIGKADTRAYGNNTFALVEQNYTGPAMGQKFLDSKLGFGRMHSDLFSDWLGADKRSYDAAKIAMRYSQSPYPPGFIIMQGIQSYFTGGFALKTDGSNQLDPSEFDAFAAFTASLVKILNVDLKQGIQYFEVGDQLDGVYRDSPNRKEQWEMWLRCAKAMKAVDPSIKLAGCAFTWDNDPIIQEFLSYSSPTGKVADYVDVVTFHRFVGGHTYDTSSEDLFNWADAYRDMGVRIRNEAKAILGTRPFEVHLNAYAISYDANPGNENRQTTWVGASMYAQVMASHAVAGLGSNIWNFKDGWNGNLDNDGVTEKPIYSVNKWFCQYLVGDIFEVPNNATLGHVFSMGVKSTAGRALLFVNRTGGDQHIVLSASVPGSAAVFVNDSVGQRQVVLSSIRLADGTLPLGPFGTSIVVY